LGGDPVDGTGRLGAGQRRRGELQLDPRARVALAPAVRDQGPGPPAGRPVRRRLQPPATPQQLRDARPCRLRTRPCRASSRSGPTGPGRVKTASRIALVALGPTGWHHSAGDCEAPSAISSPPRNGGKPKRAASGSCLLVPREHAARSGWAPQTRMSDCDVTEDVIRHAVTVAADRPDPVRTASTVSASSAWLWLAPSSPAVCTPSTMH